MNVEQRIALDAFQPRDYQLRAWDYFENKGYKKMILCWPRRSGKDVFVVNKILIPSALRNVGVYWYVWPTYAQGKKGFTDNVTNDGRRMIDFIPKQLIASFNQHEQKITLINGSLIQVIGADSNRLMGANPKGCIFSEFALFEDPQVRQYILPILRANNGWEVYVSTPRGQNAFYELWNVAKANPTQWFSELLTVEDTKHIPIEDIYEDIRTGEISEDMALQEYWCSFNRGISGSVYGKYVEYMERENRITFVPHEEGLSVWTAWDLGIKDPSVIIFFQVSGNVIRIIDYYEQADENFEHFARVLQEKPYVYGGHIPPHDIMVREMSSGITRRQRYADLGVHFIDPVPHGIDDGIERVRATLNRVWIDKEKCAPLVMALKNYRYEYDTKRSIYKSKPIHDQYSHSSDALRYLCVSLPYVRTTDSDPNEMSERFNRIRYGHQWPYPFNHMK